MENGFDIMKCVVSDHIDNTEPLSIAFSVGFYLTFHNENNREIKQKLAKLYLLYCPALHTGEFLGEDNVVLQSHIVLRVS